MRRNLYWAFSIRHAAALGAAALLVGCVSSGQPLNADVKALSPEEIRLQQVETKVAELSRRLDGMEASRNGNQVSEDVRNLRGQVEELRHELDLAQQQNATQFQSLEQRVPGGAAAAAPVAPSTETPAAPVATSDAPSAVAATGPVSGNPAPQENAAYNVNIALLQAGKYDEAIRGFRGQLDQYPQGSYADNAWYWLGQTYSVKGDYATAAQSYQTLLQRFPSSTKVPDATLSLGMVDLKLNKRDEAKSMFQKVVREYPNSRAASMANGQLSQLR